MRLLNCELQNLRRHNSLSINFSPRITLIGGPNESGKSTLVEALHRALFLKANAVGGPVEALGSRTHLGQPTVSIQFDARGSSWALKKRFSGSSGQVTLSNQGNGAQLSGPAAEEQLAQLLGVQEIVGSRQATTVLPSRWAHLWVTQGSAANNPLDADKSHYDFDSLLAQIEKNGGAAVQQSKLDQLVLQKIEAKLAENFTQRGTKKNSDLWQREQAHEKAKMHRDQVVQRLAEYERAAEDLASLEEQLSQIVDVELPALEKRNTELEASVKIQQQLDDDIRAATQLFNARQQQQTRLENEIQKYDALVREIDEREKVLEGCRKNQEAAASQKLNLDAEAHTQQEKQRALEEEQTQVNERVQLLQCLLDKARAHERLQRQKIELDTAKSNLEKRKDLAKQLAALPPLGRDDMNQLRNLERACLDVSARQQALAAGVEVLRAEQPVRVDGQVLTTGESRNYTSDFQIEIGDGVVLRITPGGGGLLGDVATEMDRAQTALQQRLEELGVSSVDAAEEIAERRAEIEKSMAGIPEVDEASLPELENELNQVQVELETIAEKEQAMSSTYHDMRHENELPTSVSDLQALHQMTSERLQRTAKNLAQQKEAVEKAQEASKAFQSTRAEEEKQITVIETELREKRTQQNEWLQEHGERESLVMKRDSGAQEVVESSEALRRLQQQKVELGDEDFERTIKALQQKLQEMVQRKEELIERCGSGRQRCADISNENPHAAVEKAEAALETATQEHRNFKRLTDAHKLLQKHFSDAQSELSSRYSEPLAQAISNYLRPFGPQGPVAHLAYDHKNGFCGLALQRGSESYAFSELSGGMREQLAAALRISMADVLKDGHDGSLPLVFDDAFTYSDPERIGFVKEMLGNAADRGLQVILLTCDPAAYGDFADARVEL